MHLYHQYYNKVCMLRIITKYLSYNAITFNGDLDRCQYSCCVAVDSLSAIFDSQIKTQYNIKLFNRLPNFRHEWHIKTHCYTLKNKQRINKLSTNDYVICKYVVNRMSDFSLKSLIRLTNLQIT